MATWADVGEWFSQAWDRFIQGSKTVITYVQTVIPSSPVSAPPPTQTGGSGGSSTGNPGTGGGSSTGSLFSEPIQFLRNITDGNTWLRVGIVLLGILLVVLAVRMFLEAESPVAKTMRAIGMD